MPLPEFDLKGDLPVAVHLATMDEVVERFGQQNKRRKGVTARLITVYNLACSTSKLDRCNRFWQLCYSKSRAK
jgi:hypothetical protein